MPETKKDIKAGTIQAKTIKVEDIKSKDGKDLSGSHPSLPPRTTVEQDKVSEGQRGINLMWETTQQYISLVVVGLFFFTSSIVVLVLIITNAIRNQKISVEELALISLCLNNMSLVVGVVIGFYYSRTNHTSTGGAGPKLPAIVDAPR